MAKGHPYEFNLGHGRLFKDYKEAARALMERNMPEILHDVQTKAIFLPETHVPKMPRIVDPEEYKRQKENFKAEDLEGLGVPKGNEDIDNNIGDKVEEELANELKKFYDRDSDTKVIILQGPTLRKRGGGNQENDFVIIDFGGKAIFCIESKASLNGKTGQKAVSQTLELKGLLEEYFATELASGQWAFVGMIYTNSIVKSICSVCSPFVINGSSELLAKLAAIEIEVKLFRKEWCPSHAEYVALVQGLVFVVLSQPISSYCTIASTIHDKIDGKSTAHKHGAVVKTKTKAKAGQGDFQSIIFWTKQQTEIMLTDQQFVFFASP